MRCYLLPLILLLGGCSTTQEDLMPVAPGTSMLTLWQQQSGGSAALLDARSQLRRPAGETLDQKSWTRDAVSEIRNQFPRLPNPDLVMYVFPHLNGNIPVPGYSSVFPFYTRTYYALPGERLTPP